MTKRKTNGQFISELAKINETVIPLEEYKTATEKILVECQVCGTRWRASPDSLLHKHGCPECMKGRISEKKRMPVDVFTEKLTEQNPTIELLEDYKSASLHIRVKCKKCGHIWSPIAKSLLSGRGCPMCANKRRSIQQRRTNESFVHDVKNKSPQIEILSEYISSEKTVKAKCNACGYEWNPIAQVLLSGAGCPNCAGNLQKTHEQFVKEVEKFNPSIKVIGKYKNAKSKVTVKCLVCGHEWDTLAGNIRKGQGCPSCEHTPTSFAEQFFLEAFRYWFGDEEVLSRNKDIIGQELDIYLPRFQTAIEVGSWYWHKNRIENDKEKKARCKEKGIRLIIIYDSFKNKTLPFSDDFISFEQDLGAQRGNTMLKKIALLIATQFEEHISEPSDSEWNIIRNKAYRQSRMNTTEDFRTRLAVMNPNIEVLGEYTRARDLIECRCLACGRTWENTPYHLLKGQGCPSCSTAARAKARLKAVKNDDTGELFESAKEAAKKYGVSASAIVACCLGKSKTCKGYHWSY